MRESGILMHITSLPGKYGIGTMGKNAFAFVDFLRQAGQSNWQILPLSPTGYGDSPYQSCSAFAGNPYLIDFDQLIDTGLLDASELEDVDWGCREDRVDFGKQYNNKLRLLRLAFDRFRGGDEFERFCRENGSWLSDYSLFMALREENGGKPWREWDSKLKFRDPDAMWQARRRLQEQIRFHCFVQFLFFTQWGRLHSYANERGISIIGDVPIYVPLDSADVWADPELFQLDEKLDPTAVAGVPPDFFSEDGQLWGNPLYRWEEMRKDGYSWWLRRLEAAGRLYDVVRLDHFRGFESYWSVPAGDKTAKGGQWVKGPDMELLSAVKEQLPKLRIIAEDLGVVTPAVEKMHAASGFPGMKVLGFAFDSREPSEYLPHNCIPNSVCYTGTHDNMTTRQWFDNASPEAVEYAMEYMRLSQEEGLVWGMIRTAMSTVSNLCIVPMQDYLDLGAEGRMNFPGTLSESNWTWRAKDDIMDRKLADRIHKLTQLYGRIVKDHKGE